MNDAPANGTVTHRGGHFIIVGVPHVLQRIKRVFGRLDRHKIKTLHFRDTLETCRDLEWVLSRWPLSMEGKLRRYIRARAKEHDRRGQEVADLFAGAAPPRAFELAVPAREYQKVAAEVLLRRRSLLLADDLGIGKSVSAICALTEPRARPALIVTLTSLPFQWQRELERFAPGLSVHIIKHGHPYALGLARADQPALIDDYPDILIINYHKLARWAEPLAGHMKMIVFDECQELRGAFGGTASWRTRPSTASA